MPRFPKALIAAVILSASALSQAATQGDAHSDLAPNVFHSR